MKGIFIIVLLLGLLIGAFAFLQKEPRLDCQTINIEGCEYLQFVSYYGYKGITHKGNCTNLIHLK